MRNRPRGGLRSRNLLTRPPKPVGQGYSGFSLLRYPDGLSRRVRCGTFMIPEPAGLTGSPQFRCRIMVWLPGTAVPVIGESIGSARCFDRALDALNERLAGDGLRLMAVGNVPGTVDEDLGAGNVFRRYRGRRVLLTEPVAAAEDL